MRERNVPRAGFGFSFAAASGPLPGFLSFCTYLLLHTFFYPPVITPAALHSYTHRSASPSYQISPIKRCTHTPAIPFPFKTHRLLPPLILIPHLTNTMSYYASMHPPVDPPTPVLTFPVSSSRDEPYTAYPSSSSSQRYDPLRMLAPPPPFPPLDPAYAQYAVKRRRQIFPGILEDGCLTIGHKFVDIYLERVARAPNDRHTHRLEPDNFFGEKRREYQSVADLLGIRQPLSQKQNDCIFTLAALKVFHTPHHPAHFTFWGKEACKKTAEKVQNILSTSVSFSPIPSLPFYKHPCIS